MKTLKLTSIISLFLLSVTLLHASLAKADATFTLSWQIPAERVDGSPLAANDIKSYDLQVKSETDTAFKDFASTDKLSHAYTANKSGKYCFRIRTVANVAGPWSQEKCGTYLSEPAAPIIILIKIE